VAVVPLEKNVQCSGSERFLHSLSSTASGMYVMLAHGVTAGWYSPDVLRKVGESYCRVRSILRKLPYVSYRCGEHSHGKLGDVWISL
jgi:hypothetical protein